MEGGGGGEITLGKKDYRDGILLSGENEDIFKKCKLNQISYSMKFFWFRQLNVANKKVNEQSSWGLNVTARLYKIKHNFGQRYTVH